MVKYQIVKTPDFIVSLAFFVLGLYLTFTATRFPPGVGTLPGPELFPMLIGLATTGLSAVLLTRSLLAAAPAQTSQRGLQNLSLATLTTLLLAFYIALWPLGYFELRTLAFLTVFLKICGERWVKAFSLAVLMTAFVVIVFELGLRVSFE